MGGRPRSERSRDTAAPKRPSERPLQPQTECAPSTLCLPRQDALALSTASPEPTHVAGAACHLPCAICRVHEGRKDCPEPRPETETWGSPARLGQTPARGGVSAPRRERDQVGAPSRTRVPAQTAGPVGGGTKLDRGAGPPRGPGFTHITCQESGAVPTERLQAPRVRGKVRARVSVETRADSHNPRRVGGKVPGREGPRSPAGRQPSGNLSAGQPGQASRVPAMTHSSPH
ncbi:PREDICTED: uncharacterized protein LOC105822762 [Propithecus coquereli]|uniref:uncharacterized protein LOC105822762 n=1 Tax=Propithecus coquereli TaxID=379532 RepID=UPI00063EFF0C|nr:PREDICTED: uncharacterized protein LOC105822762 [Propithecus coquereli]